MIALAVAAGVALALAAIGSGRDVDSASIPPPAPPGLVSTALAAGASRAARAPAVLPPILSVGAAP